MAYLCLTQVRKGFRQPEFPFFQGFSGFWQAVSIPLDNPLGPIAAASGPMKWSFFVCELQWCCAALFAAEITEKLIVNNNVILGSPIHLF